MSSKWLHRVCRELRAIVINRLICRGSSLCQQDRIASGIGGQCWVSTGDYVEFQGPTACYCLACRQKFHKFVVLWCLICCVFYIIYIYIITMFYCMLFHVHRYAQRTALHAQVLKDNGRSFDAARQKMIWQHILLLFMEPRLPSLLWKP